MEAWDTNATVINNNTRETPKLHLEESQGDMERPDKQKSEVDSNANKIEISQRKQRTGSDQF